MDFTLVVIHPAAIVSSNFTGSQVIDVMSCITEAQYLIFVVKIYY